VQAKFVRPDGFQVDDIQINGVRTFDPELGGWTTPDAYEGDIHDLASQQKYMWNRGNAIDYSDPSGYEMGPAFREGWYTPQSDSKWRLATPAEMKRLREQGVDPHGKGVKPGGSREDILIDQHGNWGVGNKDRTGEVEIMGNIHETAGSGEMRSKPKEKEKKKRGGKRGRHFF
jgi:hypothetical protein